MMFLLAQLVAPPVQVGPVRLPGPEAGEQRPAPGGSSGSRPAPIETETSPTPAGVPPGPGPAAGATAALPRIEGSTPYSPSELRRILAPCLGLADSGERLNACAAALGARLVNEGYVNTRVYAIPSPAPGALQVIDGRIVELRVNGKDERLNVRVRRLLQPIQGQVLFLPRIERQLQLLRQQPGVAMVRGNLSRLGSDASQAVLVVNVSPGGQPWLGDLSLRNEGTNGSGEFRGTAALVRPSLASLGDTLLLYTETTFSDAPQLGSVVSSLSYTYPLSDQLSLTGAFGYSRRNLIELAAPNNDYSTSQYQGLGQLEWTLKETLTQRWSLFAGFSANRSNTYFQGAALPPAPIVQEIISRPSSGYVRIGVTGSGTSDQLAWGGNAYLLQGIAATVPQTQRQELASIGVNPARATAIGALLSSAWTFAPSWQLNLRVGGQVAFNPLLPSMQFALGSDVGLRGLPGQLISGNSGLLGTAETVWTFWRNQTHALQVVPFLGAGSISSRVGGISRSDSVGSGGVLMRWLGGSSWQTELGWVEQFSADDNIGPWSDDLLNHGLYVKVGYRF